MGVENDTSSSTREAMTEVMAEVSQTIKVKDWRKEVGVIQSLLDSQTIENKVFFCRLRKNTVCSLQNMKKPINPYASFKIKGSQVQIRPSGVENDTPFSTDAITAMSQTIKVKDWRKEVGVIQSLLDSQTIENKDSRKEVGVIQKLLDSKIAEIEDLRKEVDRAQTLIEELKKELSNTQKSLATTTTENEALRESVKVTEELSNQRKKDTEDLRAKIDKLDSSKYMLQIEHEKSRMTEKLDSVVGTFQGSIPYFLAFMTCLFALRLPCKTTMSLFDKLIGLSCVGVIGLTLLGIYRSWNIYEEFYTQSKILKQSISITTNTATQPILDTNTLPSGHHSTPPSSALSSNSDLELGPTPLESKVNKYREWFYHAWPVLLHMVLVMIFAFMLNYFVGRYIYTEGCVKDVPGPTPSPSTSKLSVLVEDMAMAEVMVT